MCSSRTIVLLLWAVFTIGSLSSPVSAEIPEYINYQGILVDNAGNPVSDGAYTITFTIHEDAVVDTPVWKEEQNILVINGIFNAMLPSDSVNFPFPDDVFKAGRYLGVKVSTDAEMTPRQPLSSSPFAFLSQNAEMLDGSTVTDLDDRYVNERQPGIINSSMIEDGSITASDLADSYVGTSGGMITGSINIENVFTTGTHSTQPVYHSFGSGVPLSGQMNNTLDLFIADDLEVGGELFADSVMTYNSLFVGTDDNDDNDTIFMDASNERIEWKEDMDDAPGNGIDGGFFFSDDMEIDGYLGIGTSSPTESIHIDHIEAGGSSFVKIVSSHPSNWGEAGIRVETPQNMWHLRMDDDSNNNIPAGSLGLRDQSSGKEVMVWSQGGNIGIGANAPAAKLEIDGGVKIANDDTTCDSETAGTIRWTGSDFEGCNGIGWTRLTYVNSEVPTVTSNTGRIWMDRNLGASRGATSPSDSAAYGDLYQWGRKTDGHEQRTSATTNSISDTSEPGHGEFIFGTSYTPSWWSSQINGDLWWGVSAINNPCPSGFRVPTEEEWVAEYQSWEQQGKVGAFGSPLKLVAAGSRRHDDGTLRSPGYSGSYWASTFDGWYPKSLFFALDNNNFIEGRVVSSGLSVRCIKD